MYLTSSSIELKFREDVQETVDALAGQGLQSSSGCPQCYLTSSFLWTMVVRILFSRAGVEEKELGAGNEGRDRSSLPVQNDSCLTALTGGKFIPKTSKPNTGLNSEHIRMMRMMMEMMTVLSVAFTASDPVLPTALG